MIEEIEVGPVDEGLREALDSACWLQKAEPESEPNPLTCSRLGKGEGQVIEYARAHPGTVALLDDLSARRVASALEIPVLGTLSLLARDCVADAAIKFDDVVRRLRNAGLYIHDNVVSEVRARLARTQR